MFFYWKQEIRARYRKLQRNKILFNLQNQFSKYTIKLMHSWQPHLNQMFFHLNCFEVNGINDNRMVQGQDYMVDEASLPSLTPIIVCEWSKTYVVWRYLDGRLRLYELPVLAAFPSFFCPISLADGYRRHSNW